MVYGYCRISTKKQSIDRQVRNIRAAYPDALIRKETYTGTKIQERKELEKILKAVKRDDTIVFDSVSRMSRNAEDGFALYEKLYQEGINLVFLKEPHINTDTYRNALKNGVTMTGTNVDYILEGVNKYLMELAKAQIRLAFEQAQKEVDDLRQRTKEGIQTARLNGKQIGQEQGRKLNVKKAGPAKEMIKKYNKEFGGQLNNEETWTLTGISKMTFYKYKREIIEEAGQRDYSGPMSSVKSTKEG